MLFLLPVLAFCPNRVAAADTGGISLSPSQQEIVIDKNNPEPNFILKIINHTGEAETFRLSVVDFGSLDDSGGVAFLSLNNNDLEHKYSLASWVSLEKDAVSVDAGQTQEVKVTMLNKESLSPGGHYGAVLATLDSAGNEKGKEIVNVKQSLASLIFVKKIGGEIYNLRFSELVFHNNPIAAFNQIRLRFQNSGNIHLVLRGVVTVTDPFNRVVKSGIINPDSSLILPESFRVYKVSFDNLAANIWPGIYKINIKYRYDGKQEFSQKTAGYFFLGMPAAVFLVLLFSGGATVLIFKKNKVKK